MRGGATGLALALLAGCSERAEPINPGNPADREVGKVEAVKDVVRDNPKALEIRPMHLPDTDAYCALRSRSQEFVYDDPETWRFVFVTDPAAGDPALAHVRINEEVIDFEEMLKTSDAKDLQTWRYRSVSGDIIVELKLNVTEEGEEYTNYAGTIAIVEPTQTERIGIKGSCGV